MAVNEWRLKWPADNDAILADNQLPSFALRFSITAATAAVHFDADEFYMIWSITISLLLNNCFAGSDRNIH